MRILWLGVVLFLASACGAEDTGPPDAPPPPDSPPPADARAQPDARPVADAFSGDGVMCGDKPLFESCEDGLECDTCMCWSDDAVNFYCNKSCDGDGECPPPSPGCNMLFHVCRPPT